jgi:hypothetical protein
MKEEEKGMTNIITCGDIQVGTSTNSLETCSKMIKKLIRDEEISTYLRGTFNQKKMTGVG